MTFEEMVLGRPSGSPPSPPRTAEVTQSDATGVWCTPLRGDRRQPIGPCLGGLRHRPGPCAAGTHDHPLEQLPVGTVVLLLRTTDGPWIAAVHEGVLPR